MAAPPDRAYHREALELAGIAKRLLVENAVDRIDVNRECWIKRQRGGTAIVVFHRPYGFSHMVLVATDHGDSVSVQTFHPGAWRKTIRRAAADFDAFKAEAAE